MKKRLLSILCVLSLVLTLLPVTAMATNSTAPTKVYICGMELTDGKCLTDNNATSVTNYGEDDPYVALYQDGVLYLNGLDRTYNDTTEDRLLKWNHSNNGAHDLVIELVEGSVNTMVANNYGAINGASGWSTGPSVTIQGKGTLNVTGGTYGIWVWEDVTIQNGATVNIVGNGSDSSSTQAGVCTNASGHGLTIKQGTTVTIYGKNYGVSADHEATGLFTVLGGNLVIKGEKAALNKLSSDFGGNTVYVSNDVSGAGAAAWDGTTDLKNYKYISLTGFSNTVTTYDVTKDATTNGSFDVDFEKSVADETITITATPAGGYEVDAVTVKDAFDTDVPVTGTGNTRTFTMPASNVTANVNFKPTDYTITYNLGGGTNASANPATYTVVTDAITLVAPERSGYTFGGWFDNSGFTGTAVTTIAQGSTGNKEYWAKWTENQPAVNTISNFDELKDAFVNGGEYALTADITVTEALTLASGKALSIDGAGHVIKPMVTGLNEQGIVNENASAIANMISNAGTLTLKDLTVYGGEGRCISNSDELTLEGVSLERAHLTSGYGAGLKNASGGKVLMVNSNIRRNGCDSAGGGFDNSGSIIMENCSIVENRNFGSATGGGAGENKGTLYMNNCTVANNQSSEIGGGINNYGGTAYIMNSTFTGNVTTGSNKGGGIGYNGGNVYAANSVFAFNYSNGVNDDIGYSGSGVSLYNCAYGIVHSSVTATGCKVLDSNATPADVFNGSRTSGILDENGNETSTTFARPVITKNGSVYGVYPKTGSVLLSGGIATKYDRDGFTVKMSYGDTALGSLTAATTAVGEYQDGSTRAVGVIGALPASDAVATVYTVTVKAATGGTVTGGSAQGDTHPAGWNGSITATADTGYTFAGWLVGTDTAVTETNSTYTITNLNADLTLTPVFSASAPTTYTVTFNANGGSGTMSAQTFTSGVAQALTANAFTRSGYTFAGWASSADGAVVYSNSESVTIAANTTLYAKWTPVYTGGGSSSTPSYPVEVLTEKDDNIKTESDFRNAKSGTTVTITVTPDPYYQVEGVIVKDRNGKIIDVTENRDGTYSFKMPASKVTVEAIYAWDNPFVDVDEDAYYAPAVEWALNEGITGGTTATTFDPNAACTRAQMVTFLWRAAGSPEPITTVNPFTDVDMNSYYSKAVLWAVEQGITNGTGDGTTFSPYATCTRAQMATFLCRMEAGEASGTVNLFTDVPAGVYYTEPVQWAVENGITNGTGNGTTFSPNATCTRGQMVTFLYRCMGK